MGKEATRNEQKNQLLRDFQQFISERYNTDVLRTGPSEVVVPAVDENGEEFFFSMKIAVPRGTRNGEGGYTPYDGYAAAEDYRLEMEDKAAKKAASAEKKVAAEREKERKREAKKVVKDLNTTGLDGLIHAE